jgi:hypothetical protein
MSSVIELRRRFRWFGFKSPELSAWTLAKMPRAKIRSSWSITAIFPECRNSSRQQAGEHLSMLPAWKHITMPGSSYRAPALYDGAGIMVRDLSTPCNFFLADA